jgi:hypothetical protein
LLHVGMKKLHGLTGAAPSGRASAELQPLPNGVGGPGGGHSSSSSNSAVALQQVMMNRDAMALAGVAPGVRPIAPLAQQLQRPDSPPFQLTVPHIAVAQSVQSAAAVTGGGAVGGAAAGVPGTPSLAPPPSTPTPSMLQPPSSGSGPDCRTYVQVLQPAEMVAELRKAPYGVESYDANGWNCLHWAAHLGKPDHAAALLDSGANPLAPTTAALALPGWEWPAGTPAESLARWPEGEHRVGGDRGGGGGGGGGRGHQLCRGMLTAAARGGFKRRRESKARGDALMQDGSCVAAAAAYAEALGAVLQVKDSAVLQIVGPLAAAEKAVEVSRNVGGSQPFPITVSLISQRRGGGRRWRRPSARRRRRGWRWCARWSSKHGPT